MIMNKNLFFIILIAAAVGLGLFAVKNYSGQGSTGNGVFGGVLNKVGGSPAGNTSSKVTLNITSPLDGSTVSTPVLKIVGQTAANADVSVNDSEIKADASGNFTFSLQLDEGDNDIVVVANDASGNSAEREFVVTYTPAGQ